MNQRLSTSHFARAIDDHLADCGLQIENIRHTGESEIVWRFHTSDRVSCIIRLFFASNHAESLLIESAFGVVKKSDDLSSLTMTLLLANAEISNPARLALHEEGDDLLFIAQSWFTSDQVYATAVGDIIEAVLQAAVSMKDQAQVSLPQDWFRKSAE